MKSRPYNTEFIIFTVVSAILYGVFLYATPRTNFIQIILLFAGLSVGYLLLLWRLHQAEKEIPSIWFILAPAILFRIIALFALPNLSDDYFRFIWDGQLLNHDVNPFLQLPSAYMQDPSHASSLGLTKELFEGLNSPDYFTIYPPVLQAVFFIGAWMFPTNIYGAVITMKAVIFLAEMGSLAIIIQLLRSWKIPLFHLGIYAFNPLVIIELSGNLHFEALMIFFLLLAIALLNWKPQGWIWSAGAFALAVCSKLLPLMLLPLFIRRLGWKKAILYGVIVAGVSGLLFLPLFDWETFIHLKESVGLYFQTFEFNASIYYLVRWVGYQIMGYNIIQIAGPVLAIITVLGIFAFTFFEKEPTERNLPEGMMWVFVIYFSLTAIVHPWYSTTLIAFCLFTRFRFAVVWSLLMILTYSTYQTSAYTENLLLVGIEYFCVITWGITEVSNLFPTKTVKH